MTVAGNDADEPHPDSGGETLPDEEPEPADSQPDVEVEVEGDGETPGAALVRPGPVVLDADSWVEESTEAHAIEYQGRRRAEAAPARLWVAVLLVLLGLGAAVAIPLAISGGGADVALDVPKGGDVPIGDPAILIDVTGPPTVSASPMPRASAGPSPTPAATPTTSATASASTSPPSPTPSPSTTPPTPPFTPVSYEAEAGSRTGSARIWDNYPNNASGGRVVRNIGNWGEQDGPGTLRINNVIIPTAGVYRLTIYFVHPDGERNRSATVTISGRSPLTVAFAGDDDCCGQKVVDNLSLTPGTYTITFANATGRAPSIDRVVLSRP